MGRIDSKFQALRKAGRKAFIPFITLGDPDFRTTRQIVLALVAAGADLIELGVPFSDPVADGPVIQRASERALNGGGFSLRRALHFVAELRNLTDVPFILFSYYNPLFAYGFENLIQEAKGSGLDGFLITDLSVEEAEAPVARMQQASLDCIFLTAPTSTSERIAKIARYSSGFIYAVSRTGVTGEQTSISDDAKTLVARIREHSTLPVAVGFGISTPEQVREIGHIAEGIVVGSAIVRCIEENLGNPQLAEKVGSFARWLRGGM
ncbi:MAG: tryptophan synthase subunit alpha [Terriglobia bacterium]